VLSFASAFYRALTSSCMRHEDQSLTCITRPTLWRVMWSTFKIISTAAHTHVLRNRITGAWEKVVDCGRLQVTGHTACYKTRRTTNYVYLALFMRRGSVYWLAYGLDDRGSLSLTSI